jgi:hypothetical protein
MSDVSSGVESSQRYLPNVSIDAEPVILPMPMLLPELLSLSLSLFDAASREKVMQCNYL